MGLMEDLCLDGFRLADSSQLDYYTVSPRQWHLHLDVSKITHQKSRT